MIRVGVSGTAWLVYIIVGAVAIADSEVHLYNVTSADAVVNGVVIAEIIEECW